MTEPSALREKMDRASEIADSIERRLWVLAVITEAVAPYDLKPILVGGAAVEFYTFGGYATKDMDLVTDSVPALERSMIELGFTKDGRYWIREDIDALIEVPDNALAGDADRVTEYSCAAGTVSIISPEDLIIDRLNAAVHWKSQDDLRWATRVLVSQREAIDFDYLRARAEAEGTVEALETAMSQGLS